jgi:predicted RNA-binding Zn-ribbon protein involved in translation (DUF1610 family)
MPFIRFAHCPKCGSLEVQRISAEHGDGRFRFLWRAMRLSVYRCPPCRERFYSVLPRKNDEGTQSAPVAN